VVEVAGHGTHATRRQRQRDAQRQAELAAIGCIVITFTYEDVMHRPEYVVATLRRVLMRTAA
jgi:very-short-patch-repair endonuclease